MGEPLITNKTDNGRPPIADEQYGRWLDDMKPFLRQGASLWAAIEKAGLESHMASIYVKYRLGDWFSQKIDRLQATIVELANNVIFNTIQRAYDRMAVSKDATVPLLTTEEVQLLKLVAEKHRSAQPFYTNRTEEAKAKDKDFGKVVNDLPVIEYVQPQMEVDAQNTTGTNTQAASSVATPN